LVDAIPKDDSDPNFMVLLWNGESLPFLEGVCKELDRAELPVATPRVKILLRDRADRYHLKHLKTFPYVLGVFKRDFAAARKILESAAEENLPAIVLPPLAAYPEPFDEHAPISRIDKSTASLKAIVTIYSSEDLRAVEFVEASLDGLDIPFRRVCLASGVYEIQVRPADENSARHVIQEIASGTSTQTDEAEREDTLLRDEPPKSYFLLWLITLIYYPFGGFFFLASPGHAISSGASQLFFLLLMLGFLLDLFGMVWMMCQAMRYEVRSFRYCVATQFPLACVWYYVERVMARKGAQKLPISARLRMQPPQT